MKICPSGSDEGMFSIPSSSLEEFGDFDDHSQWSDIPDEHRERIENKIKGIIRDAVNHADTSGAGGWGNISADLQAEIRKSVAPIIDWKSVLRQFIGSLIRGERRTSIKRINRKYPYIHPGVSKNHVAKLLIAIDMSGSVDDEQLASFFAALTILTKKISVDILPFDCEADVKDVYEWKKGTIPNLTRTKSGGTNFDAPSNVANAPENRGRWDGYLIMTDGECGEPKSSRVKRGWVLSKGHDLYFKSNELQIFIDDSKPMIGAWR